MANETQGKLPFAHSVKDIAQSLRDAPYYFPHENRSFDFLKSKLSENPTPGIDRNYWLDTFADFGLSVIAKAITDDTFSEVLSDEEMRFALIVRSQTELGHYRNRMAAKRLGIPVREGSPYGHLTEGMSLNELQSKINTLAKIQFALLKKVSPQSNPERQ